MPAFLVSPILGGYYLRSILFKKHYRVCFCMSIFLDVYVDIIGSCLQNQRTNSEQTRLYKFHHSEWKVKIIGRIQGRFHIPICMGTLPFAEYNSYSYVFQKWKITKQWVERPHYTYCETDLSEISIDLLASITPYSGRDIFDLLELVFVLVSWC